MSMRVSTLSSLLLLGVACNGAETPRAPSPKVSAPSAPSSSARPAASSDPTELSEADKARDKALAPRVEAIIKAYGTFDARLAPDGKQFLFRSNRDGVPELFVAQVDKPADAPIKVVPGPERVGNAQFSRDGKWIVFARDKGADENYRLYRIKPDGTDLTELTPGESLHRDDPLLPRAKPDMMVFTARTTTSPKSMLHVASLSTAGDAKVILTDPGPTFAVAVSPDGERALMVRFISPSNQDVFEANLGSAKMQRVYPPEGTSAGIGAIEYSADGKLIFIATNEGKSTNVLLALDSATYKETARYLQDRPSTASIDQLLVAPKGNRVAIGVDAGNKNDVRVLDARTLKLITDVKLPLGATYIDSFSADGKRFSVTQSLPDSPPDVSVVDAQSGALEALRKDERPGLGALAGIESRITTVTAHDGLEIPVHFYLPGGYFDPKDRNNMDRLPVIAHFHGGPASSSRVQWSWAARWFTSQGFAFVEPNIRGSTGFGRDYEMADNREKRADAIQDLATINQWLRKQSWADPDRLVIYGGSYGGYLVLMGLTRQPKLWRAGVDIVGVANLFTFLESTDQTIRTAFIDEFGDLDKDKALLDTFSPMRDKNNIVAPLFVYQGQNDPRVPRTESDQVVKSLRGRGVPVEYMVAPNEGHSLDRKENRIEFATRVVRFLGDRMNPKLLEER